MRKPTMKRSVILSVVCCLAMGLFIAGCAPQNQSSLSATGDAEASETETSAMDFGYADFTDRSTGLYPDINKNAQYQNSGNRGCVACHEDLFDVDKDNGSYTHITTYAGLKNGTYTGDCITCHNAVTGTAGNVMSENIHVSHYSEPLFVEANGNCWSCHSMTDVTLGDGEMLLFEQIQYDVAYGGYPDTVDNPATLQWNKDRGFPTGFLSGVTPVSDPDLNIELDQAVNEEEKEFRILNYDKIDGEDGYDTIEKVIADGSWRLVVEGTNNDHEVTLDELKAMPATEITAAQWCLVNGINSAMIDNRPMKGVLLKDFIDALGGVKGNANTITSTASDNWKGHPLAGGADLQDYIDSDTILVYEMYGHDLTLEQGAPVMLFTPGTGGGIDVKNLVGLQFFESDNHLKFADVFPTNFELGLMWGINTSWFDNDGVSGKVGQPMAIEGASYSWSTGSFNNDLDKVLISMDYGMTWVEADAPDDFDPKQWVHFTINWTPEEAGTYILKAKGVDKNGVEQAQVSNLIVTVEE